MTIKIRTFGKLTEIVTDNILVLENNFDTNNLRIELQKKYPTFQNAKFALAVNNRLADGNVKLEEGDIVSLLPPFSGG